MKKPKKCGSCNSTDLTSSKKLTPSLPWKDYPLVFIYQAKNLTVCQQCHEPVFSAYDGKLIDELVTNSISSQIRLFVKTIIQREKCEQNRIAKHLGISSEYLSEIRSGSKIPKFQTFNFLKTLAYSENAFKVSAP